jgi:hypothetical protein
MSKEYKKVRGCWCGYHNQDKSIYDAHFLSDQHLEWKKNWLTSKEPSYPFDEPIEYLRRKLKNERTLASVVGNVRKPSKKLIEKIKKELSNKKEKAA